MIGEIDEGGAAALESLKEIIRGNIPADKVDAHAMRLLGESEGRIDGETRELFEALRQQSRFRIRLRERSSMVDVE